MFGCLLEAAAATAAEAAAEAAEGRENKRKGPSAGASEEETDKRLLVLSQLLNLSPKGKP